MSRFLLFAALLVLGGCPPAPLTLVLDFQTDLDQDEFLKLNQIEFIFCREASGCDEPGDFQVDTISITSPEFKKQGETVTFIPDRSFVGGEPILFHVSATDDQNAPTLEFFGFRRVNLPDPFQGPQEEVITLRQESPLQRLQDGTVPLDSEVEVSKVFVTAIQRLGGGDFVLFVQEPEGKTVEGLSYPEFAGMRVFLDNDLIGVENINFSEETIQINDCIAFSGKLLEFNGNTNVENIKTFFEVTQCGGFPSPFQISDGDFEEIATDIDEGVVGDQAGANAEAFESVLIQVNDIDVLDGTVVNGSFRVSDGDEANLLIDDFLFPAGQVLSAQNGQTFSSITGIYSQFNTFRLQPRSPEDLIPQ